MNNINKWITGGLIVLAGLSFIVLYIYQGSQDHGQPVLVIYKNGALYQKLNLTKDLHKEFNVTSGGHFNTIEIKGKAVRIKEADCPRKICVHTGWLHKPGQIAVCMPNRLKISIEGRSDNVDDISF